MNMPRLVYTVTFEFEVEAAYPEDAAHILDDIRGRSEIQEINIRVEEGEDEDER